MDVNAYFKRINYKGGTTASLQNLKSLQKAHLLNLPFENLDIHYNIPIRLDIDRIFKKIILNNRGGFCYELNALFFELLSRLGFNAKRISARVYDPDKGFGKEFDHLAIIVKINGKEYLTDVGFGDFSTEPLSLETRMSKELSIKDDKTGTREFLTTFENKSFSEENTDEAKLFYLKKNENGYFCLFKNEQNNSHPKYKFKTKAYPFDAFSDMCHYHQSSPESFFTQQKLISILTESGRITLSSSKIKILENNSVKEENIDNEKDFEEKLFRYFKIKMPKN
jgi:N-hydroxyarylamine O-acetyltransferase